MIPILKFLSWFCEHECTKQQNETCAKLGVKCGDYHECEARLNKMLEEMEK